MEQQFKFKRQSQNRLWRASIPRASRLFMMCFIRKKEEHKEL